MKKLFIAIVLIGSIAYAQNIYTIKEITKDNDGYMVENKSNKKINGIVKEYYKMVNYGLKYMALTAKHMV